MSQDLLKKSPTTGVDLRSGSKFGAKVKARIVAKIQLVMDNTSLKNPRKYAKVPDKKITIRMPKSTTVIPSIINSQCLF
jgi:hypothetical protein